MRLMVKRMSRNSSFHSFFINSGAHETIERENDELVEGLSQKVDALRSVRTYSAWPMH